MEVQPYYTLGTDWVDDPGYNCCKKDPSDTPTGCDCCYDTWTEELINVKKEYNKVSEQANQINEKYKFTTTERDKLRSWFDDLIKADQLARAVCNSFEIMSSHTEKICINSGKSLKSIEILFCMVRDLFEQIDSILDIYTKIDKCIQCLNNEELPENSGIRKCLKNYLEKLDAVIKTRSELIKALMKAIRDANVLHEGICSDYGLTGMIDEWQNILNCDEECNGNGKSAEEQSDDKDAGVTKCRLKPILTLPICNDPYYAWVKTKYEEDVAAANTQSTELVEANKKKEALSACQSSLIAAIKEVDPKELCK